MLQFTDTEGTSPSRFLPTSDPLPLPALKVDAIRSGRTLTVQTATPLSLCIAPGHLALRFDIVGPSPVIDRFSNYSTRAEFLVALRKHHPEVCDAAATVPLRKAIRGARQVLPTEDSDFKEYLRFAGRAVRSVLSCDHVRGEPQVSALSVHLLSKGTLLKVFEAPSNPLVQRLQTHVDKILSGSGEVHAILDVLGLKEKVFAELQRVMAVYREALTLCGNGWSAVAAAGETQLSTGMVRRLLAGHVPEAIARFFPEKLSAVPAQTKRLALDGVTPAEISTLLGAFLGSSLQTPQVRRVICFHCVHHNQLVEVRDIVKKLGISAPDDLPEGETRLRIYSKGLARHLVHLTQPKALWELLALHECRLAFLKAFFAFRGSMTEQGYIITIPNGHPLLVPVAAIMASVGCAPKICHGRKSSRLSILDYHGLRWLTNSDLLPSETERDRATRLSKSKESRPGIAREVYIRWKAYRAEYPEVSLATLNTALGTKIDRGTERSWRTSRPPEVKRFEEIHNLRVSGGIPDLELVSRALARLQLVPRVAVSLGRVANKGETKAARFLLRFKANIDDIAYILEWPKPKVIEFHRCNSGTPYAKYPTRERRISAWAEATLGVGPSDEMDTGGRVFRKLERDLIRLSRRIVNKLQLTVSDDELLSEIGLKFVHVFSKYDPILGAKFTTVFTLAMERHFLSIVKSRECRLRNRRGTGPAIGTMDLADIEDRRHLDQRFEHTDSVHGLLRDLDPRDRRIVSLRLIQELSGPEVAKIVGVSDQTVYNIVQQFLNAARLAEKE